MTLKFFVLLQDEECPEITHVLQEAVKAFISTFLTTEVVTSPTEADVIVISDNSTLHELYSPNKKEFICIQFERNKFDSLGLNVSIYDVQDDITSVVIDPLIDHLVSKKQPTIDDLMDVCLALYYIICIMPKDTDN